MKRPASLAGRLLAVAALSITAAILIAGIAIGLLLHRFVQRTVDERLDTQIVFLVSALRADPGGALTLTGNADGPPFDRPGRGWYWQVRGPVNTLKARALRDDRLDVSGLDIGGPPPPPPALAPPPGDAKHPFGPPPRPADGPGPDGRAQHFRIKSVMVGDTPAEIVAAAPRSAVSDPLFDALTKLGLCLVGLALVLMMAITLQVRWGLRPLAQLRAAIADIRAGRRERLPDDQPAEVQPLADELNALLAQNKANLERARGHVANLAHGLKTPLATLSVALSAKGRRDRDLTDLVDVMERRVRHHLGRARSAALGGPVRAQTPLAPALAALGAVLAKVHAERQVEFAVDVPADLAVACEPQDFDEIAGNLLDNAFKWTRQIVRVGTSIEDRSVVVLIDDDGPGLSAGQIEQVLQPGQRLDESAPGFGFGLSITRELVELYGGTLSLESSIEGGLRASVSLPAATDTSVR